MDVKKIVAIDTAFFVLLAALSFVIMQLLTGGSKIVNGVSVGGVAYAVILPVSIFAPLTCWFLLKSLKEFKTASRHAYYLITAGIFLFAVAQIEQIVMALAMAFYPRLPDTLGVTVISLLFLIPFSASLFALYLGLRKLARLLNIKSLWRSVVFTLIFSAVIAGLCLLLPLSDPTLTQVFQILLFCGGITFAATFLGHRIASAISSSYRPAMLWMVAGLTTLTVAIVLEAVLKGTELIHSIFVQYCMDLLPFLLAAFLFLQAGRAFKAATFTHLPTTATYVDAVIFTAQLVSNATEVDPILDKVRLITVRHSESSSAHDKQALLDVYLQLETYLIKKEPLRNFTTDSLRERLPSDFQQALTNLRTS